jgi:alpha-1,3-glucosyltransferase
LFKICAWWRQFGVQKNGIVEGWKTINFQNFTIHFGQKKVGQFAILIKKRLMATLKVSTIFLILLSLKLLWIFTYFSTDFHVHRNWMAIVTLPSSQWYYESTSLWTLDYPPFFAYFELILSKILSKIDKTALVLTSQEINTTSVIIYQRLTVIISEIVYYYGAFKLSNHYKSHHLLIILLTNPGLLLVDHIHFQYNAMLYGMEMISFVDILEGRFVRGGVWFGVVLCFKVILVNK